MKLGTLLLRNAAIGLSQLEGALRNQVLYGGRLGTNLVELGFVDLELLSDYLAELSGHPTATPRLLDGAEPAGLEQLGADDAHRLRAIPLGNLDGDGTMAVAMVDPDDREAVAELTARLGTPVTPYIVPELRALYYLEKLFGLPRRARFVRSGRPATEAEPEPTAERRRSQPAQGIVMPPALTVEPRRRRNSSQMPLGDAVPLALTFGAACQQIDAATHRDQIAETLVEFGKGRCDALISFLIRDGNALGWRGWVAPPARPKVPIEELSLPLGGVSALQSAHDTGDLFHGPPPSEGRPVETQLWTSLGVNPEPLSVVVVPILVRQRPVNLVYAHCLTGPPPDAMVTELMGLADRIQTTYLRLIKQARGT